MMLTELQEWLIRAIPSGGKKIRLPALIKALPPRLRPGTGAWPKFFGALRSLENAGLVTIAGSAQWIDSASLTDKGLLLQNSMRERY